MIFIDTGAFVGRYVQRDQHHRAAAIFWSELATSTRRCFTSNLVLSETLTLLARWTDYRFAAERARQLYSSSGRSRRGLGNRVAREICGPAGKLL